MTPERWSDIERIYHAARSRNTLERAAFLAEACAGDEALRREVESLLGSEPVAGFLSTPALGSGTLIGRASFVGRQLGPFAIQSPLGAGGMGEVYRARDAKLGRDVAIKVLPRAFTSDPDRLARFKREARVLASLNHPQIGAIYGLEDVDGIPALVMELVEGEDLAHRIARGPIPLADALPMAMQIAEALEAAHDKSIVHRDLKPANIKITPEGIVKVLDFGLAKPGSVGADPSDAPAEQDITNSPTMMASTGERVILGTAAYMSPEQARGKVVDKRTDIWAFGCVLYEMLTGRPPFLGATLSDTIASILEREPPWTALPSATPAGIRRLLKRCLEKEPKRRLRDAGDVRLEIDEAQSEPRMDAYVVSSVRRHGERLVWIAVAAATLIAAVAVAWDFRTVPSVPEMRLEITTPPTTEPESLAISPDGQKIVFVATPNGRPQLWLRSLDSIARPLPGTDNASSPFWSPDSRSLGFFGDGKMKRIDLDSGSIRALAEASGRGGTWNADGVILFSTSLAGQLFRVPASGGEVVALPQLDLPRISTTRSPHFLPGGRQFLFYAEGSENTQGIYLGSLESRQTKRLIAADTAGAYLPPGWLLFIRQGTLVGRRFDLSRGELTGDSVTIADPVAFNRSGGVGAFSVSDTGAVIFRSGGSAPRQLTWFDRSGNALGTIGAPDQNELVAPALSPDGRQAVVHRTVEGNTDLWLLDTARTTRFTFHADLDRWGIWSPDGSHIVFGSNKKGVRDLYQKPSNGAGSEELLLESPQDKAANSWSPDGRFILYTNMDPQKGPDLSVLPLDGDRKPFVFLSTRFDERVGQFSPDGRWVAYQSNESGRNEVYVRPFPGPGGQSQVSTTGGIQTRWRRDGKELYYIAPDGKLMAVPIAVKGDTLEPGVPMALFQTRIWGGGTNYLNRQQYDVAPDDRFLINVTTEDTTNPITLLLNWKPKR